MLAHQNWSREVKIRSILGLIPHSSAFLSLEPQLKMTWADFLNRLSDEALNDALLILREEQSVLQDIREQALHRKQKLRA